MPKRQHSRAKIRAYKRHWHTIDAVRDELSRQYIHDDVKISQIAREAQLSYPTVKRFFHFGRGGGKQTYSLFHGPSVTTLFGIADALGLEIGLQKKNR